MHILLCRAQTRVQGNVTDFTHVSGLSLYTHGGNFGTALVVDLSGPASSATYMILSSRQHML